MVLKGAALGGGGDRYGHPQARPLGGRRRVQSVEERERRRYMGGRGKSSSLKKKNRAMYAEEFLPTKI